MQRLEDARCVLRKVEFTSHTSTSGKTRCLMGNNVMIACVSADQPRRRMMYTMCIFQVLIEVCRSQPSFSFDDFSFFSLLTRGFSTSFFNFGSG